MFLHDVLRPLSLLWWLMGQVMELFLCLCDLCVTSGRKNGITDSIDEQLPEMIHRNLHIFQWEIASQYISCFQHWSSSFYPFLFWKGSDNCGNEWSLMVFVGVFHKGGKGQLWKGERKRTFLSFGNWFTFWHHTPWQSWVFTKCTIAEGLTGHRLDTGFLLFLSQKDLL